MGGGGWWADIYGVREESDTTERLHFHFSLSCIGEGNGNPLQCSCLENPRDGGAWWADVYGVAQSRTRLKRLRSSSSTYYIPFLLMGVQNPGFTSQCMTVSWRMLLVQSGHMTSAGPIRLMGPIFIPRFPQTVDWAALYVLFLHSTFWCPMSDQGERARAV